MKLRVLALSLLVAAVGLALVPVAAPQTKATTSTVTVTMKEFKFTLSTKTVHHGSVTFKLVNKGHLGHDFSISGHKSKTIGAGKTGTLTGTLSFLISAAALKHPAGARFSVPGSATLTASWAGELRGRRLGEAYRCTYRGKNVPGRVAATLSNGGARGRLRLVLRALGKGFF